MKKIAIIGGGISGLVAAYTLQEQSKIPVEISLFEASPRLGGVIETESRGEFILENGPDCFLSKNSQALDLIRRLGLEKELITTREAFRRSFIYLDKKLLPIPEGFYLMAPQKWSTLLSMPHLNLFGKLRASLEFFLPKRQKEEDESIAHFISRRLGKQVFERLGQPMVGGIYGGDPFKLSIQATLPQFPKMEKEYGSILRGLSHQKGKAEESASGPRYSLFLSFRGGMEQLTRQLVKSLDKVKVFTACKIDSLQFQNGIWSLGTEGGRRFEADAVLSAAPAYRTAEWVENFSPELSQALRLIPFESMATVNLIYKRSEIPDFFKGVGFVIPKIEKTGICACTYVNHKFEGRSPEEYALLRAFVGGALYQEYFKWDDKALEEMVEHQLRDILGLKNPPLQKQVRRYARSMPQYEIGHFQKVTAIRQRLQNHPGLFVTGNSYDGIGIPDCMVQSQIQAGHVLTFLAK